MLRRPPQQTFQTFYPPTRKGQKKGMRKKKKTKTKRRKKTNLRREIKREQTASMPFRTFQQVQKTAPNYQQSLDFLTLHQQSLINQQRDLAEQQRRLTKEKIEKEELDKERDRNIKLQEIQLEQRRLSNIEKRDLERGKEERLKERRIRRGERQERIRRQAQREEDIRRDNQNFFNQLQRQRQEYSLRQQDQQIKQLEIAQNRAIAQDNNRQQERLALQSYNRQAQQNRLMRDFYSDLSHHFNQRLAEGERRQGELTDRITTGFQQLIQQTQQQPPINIHPPNIRVEAPQVQVQAPPPANISIGEGARIVLPQPAININQPAPRPIPLPDIEEIDDAPTTPSLSQLRARMMVQEAQNQPPPLSEAEQQEIRDRIYESLNRARATPVQTRPPPSPSPSAEELSPAERGQRRYGGGDEGIDYRNQRLLPSAQLDALRQEAERLRRMTTSSNEERRQRALRQFIDEEGIDDDVVVMSPRPPIPTPQLEPETTLGGQVLEGLGQGGALVGEAIGSGLQRAGQSAVGVASDLAQGVATGVYDATIGQLPSESEVGQALGSGAVQGVSNVVGGVATGIGQATGLLEPEPELTEQPQVSREENEIRIQARLDEYQRLVNTNKDSLLKKQVGVRSGAKPKLVILEDLPKNWYKGNRGAIPTKKGTYPMINYGGGASNVNNTRGFNFSGGDRGQFALQLYDPQRQSQITTLIRQGKIKFVYDE